MNLVWTDTVPRRLIDPAGGELAVVRGCTLRFPYTDCATQAKASR
jgi:hypothetical protein